MRFILDIQHITHFYFLMLFIYFYIYMYILFSLFFRLLVYSYF